MEKETDLFNCELKVGDVVAYSTRLGNSSSLHIGYVIELQLDDAPKVYMLLSNFKHSNFEKPKKTKFYTSNYVILDKNKKEIKDFINQFPAIKELEASIAKQDNALYT